MDALRAQRREESVSTSIDDAKKRTHRFLLMSNRTFSHKSSSKGYNSKQAGSAPRLNSRIGVGVKGKTKK